MQRPFIIIDEASTVSPEQWDEVSKRIIGICICGNRGYTALMENTHLEGCPNYIANKKE